MRPSLTSIFLFVAVGIILLLSPLVIEFLRHAVYYQPIVSRAQLDMDAIGHTIVCFENTHGQLPTKKEFLDLSLIQKRKPQDDGEIVPLGTKVNRITDPFGNTYFYSRFSDEKGFLLKSLGLDGKTSSDDIIWQKK